MSVNIALLTVTDTRTFDNDKSGAILVDKIKEANHKLIDRRICKDIKDWEMQLEEFFFLNEVDIKKDLNEIEKKLSEDYSKEKYKKDWFSIFKSININKLLSN